jgi:hypothetical protein
MPTLTNYVSVTCRFMETILSLQQWKKSMEQMQLKQQNQKETRLSRWFHQTFDKVLSLLLVYFDRIQAFSKPLHGFDITRLMQGKSVTENYDHNILDFLHRQEKGGAPTTAVAIVLDAGRTGNEHVERGFQLKNVDKKEEVDSGRLSWPAIYLRSTIHLSAASSAANTSGHTSSGILHGWSSTSLASSPSRRSIPGSSAKWTVMEYGPDYGQPSSWPHTEWGDLVGLLDSEVALAAVLPQATPTEVKQVLSETTVAYRENAESVSKPPDAVDEGMQSPSRTPKPPKSLSSTFHIVSLSRWMSMVVIVRVEGGHRRRGSHATNDQEDIQNFLNVMASKLRISSNFSTQSIPPPRKHQLQLSLEDIVVRGQPNDGVPVWTDAGIESLLTRVKESFDLRPANPVHQGDGLRGRTPRTSPFRRSRQPLRRGRQVSLDFSATSFFLGDKLSNEKGDILF